MIEREKKISLAREEYLCLKNHFGVGKPTIRQINHYYDTDDAFLNRQNITCRIRERNGVYKGTVKQHLAGSDCSTETPVAVRGGWEDNAFLDMGLQWQGKLITERCVICKTPECEVVLDKNEYLGVVDYELEAEYSLHHEKDALLIIEKIMGVLSAEKNEKISKLFFSQSLPAPSKSCRFFERKREK